MRKNKVQNQNEQVTNVNREEEQSFLTKNKKDIKDLIAPAGIDATSTNHLEIVSTTTKYARAMVVSALPRMCTFPSFLRGMYNFGDINVSVFINPVSEAKSQNELNRTINELESERIVAANRGNINRESLLEVVWINYLNHLLCVQYLLIVWKNWTDKQNFFHQKCQKH